MHENPSIWQLNDVKVSSMKIQISPHRKKVAPNSLLLKKNESILYFFALAFRGRKKRLSLRENYLLLEKTFKAEILWRIANDKFYFCRHNHIFGHKVLLSFFYNPQIAHILCAWSCQTHLCIIDSNRAKSLGEHIVLPNVCHTLHSKKT